MSTSKSYKNDYHEDLNKATNNNNNGINNINNNTNGSTHNNSNSPKPTNDKNYRSEYASNTCFSSEQEQKFNTKTSKISKIGSAFKKSFIPPNQNIEPTSKFSDLKDRTIWTINLLIGFILIIMAGQFYCSLLIFFVIMAIYSELLDLSIYKERNKEVKNYYLLSWYFFFVCIYFSYIRMLGDKLMYLQSYIPIVVVIKLNLNSLDNAQIS